MRAPLVLSLFLVVVVPTAITAQCDQDARWELNPLGLAAGDSFGSSVAISDTWAVAGSPAVGTVTLFQLLGNSWVERQTLTAPDTPNAVGFGNSVALDDDRLLVGYDFDSIIGGTYIGPNKGSVYSFRRSGITWSFDQEFTAAAPQLTARFGSAIAIQGDVAVVGAAWDSSQGLFSGAVYLMRDDGVQWTQQEKMWAPGSTSWEFLGTSVALDGNFVVAGAPGDDKRGLNAGVGWMFTFTARNWSALQMLVSAGAFAGDGMGTSVAIRGMTAFVGSPGSDNLGLDAGQVHVFRQNAGGLFKELPPLTFSDGVAGDLFGTSLSASGNRVAVGAPGRNRGAQAAGSVQWFHDNGMDWSGVEIGAGNAAPSNSLGASVAMDGDLVVMGAPGAGPAGPGSGSVYAYRANRLAFMATPSRAAVGVPLTMSVCKGEPGTLLVLAVTDVSGVSMFLPIQFAWFDASGAWSWSQNVPPGLSGNTADLTTVGWSNEDGRLEVSYPATVTFL